LKKFFDNEKIIDDTSSNSNLEILCGLMIEAANTDGQIDEVELEKISSVLINTFQENPLEVETYLNKAKENSNNTKSLYYYTSKINKNFSEENKLLLIETLWEVILSDGRVDDFESSLIRRISGLLYISDVSSGNARKRALNKIK
tara:strand:- start:19 stop:453 length:435 start_codon:yes stop_codon:yes gene_type:complete